MGFKSRYSRFKNSVRRSVLHGLNTVHKGARYVSGKIKAAETYANKVFNAAKPFLPAPVEAPIQAAIGVLGDVRTAADGVGGVSNAAQRALR